MAPRGSILERFFDAFRANVGVKLVSLAIAIVLWSVVLGSRNVEVTKEIPLEVVTPADLVPANDIPSHIAFRLSGPKAFLRTILDRREDPIRVNLAGAKPGLVTYRFFSDNIRVPIGVKVLQIIPASIPIRIEMVKRRDVPVRVEIRGAPPEGYRLVKTEVKPEVARIKGPESRVDGITELRTMPVDVSNLKQTLDREVAIDLSRHNVQLDGPLPRVLVEIEPVSANFRIKNVDIRVLSPYKVRVEEKGVTVLVRADLKDLKLLDRSNVYAVVDLTGKPKGKYTVVPKVTLPGGVGLVKIIPDHVKVTLY